MTSIKIYQYFLLIIIFYFRSQSTTSSPNSGRHKGAHHLSDNSVFVNIPTQSSREKHVSAALKRIQREKDNFDEL